MGLIPRNLHLSPRKEVVLGIGKYWHFMYQKPQTLKAWLIDLRPPSCLDCFLPTQPQLDGMMQAVGNSFSLV